MGGGTVDTTTPTPIDITSELIEALNSGTKLVYRGNLIASHPSEYTIPEGKLILSVKKEDKMISLQYDHPSSVQGAPSHESPAFTWTLKAEEIRIGTYRFDLTPGGKYGENLAYGLAIANDESVEFMAIHAYNRRLWDLPDTDQKTEWLASGPAYFSTEPELDRGLVYTAIREWGVVNENKNAIMLFGSDNADSNTIASYGTLRSDDNYSPYKDARFKITVEAIKGTGPLPVNYDITSTLDSWFMSDTFNSNGNSWEVFQTDSDRSVSVPYSPYDQTADATFEITFHSKVITDDKIKVERGGEIEAIVFWQKRNSGGEDIYFLAGNYFFHRPKDANAVSSELSQYYNGVFILFPQPKS